MKKVPVKVVDGHSSDNIQASSEPIFTARDKISQVMEELFSREPIFHREEYGLTRDDFERMTESSFWEVGASGKRYSREYVIETLVSRYKKVKRDIWHIDDFQCQEIAPDNYLVTYTLYQGDRVSRRSTIWRRDKGNWKTVYHQGTLVEESA